MQDWVKARLERIASLFPPARVAASRARLTRLWRGELPADRPPLTFWPPAFDYYDRVPDFATRLRGLLDDIILHGSTRDDFVPHLFPGCRQATLSTMLGASEVLEGDSSTCERLLRTPADIDRLPEPRIRPGTPAQMWLDLGRYLLDETDGRLPVSVTDMQGPIDACAQMWSYDDLILTAYEDPQRYARALGLVTDAFILLWRAQKQLLGEHFVGTHLFGCNWVPPDFGASVSMDSLVMMSPAFYRDFAAPYLVRIGDAFGDLSVHSCGQFGQTVPELCATRHVRAINASQMSIPQLLAAGLDPRTTLLVVVPYEERAAVAACLRQHPLRTDITIGGFPWPQTDGHPKPPDAWTAADRDAVRRAEDELFATFGG